jgi:predicted metalloprotease
MNRVIRTAIRRVASARFVVAVGILAATMAAGGSFAQQAAAMSPPQTTEAGVVNLLASRSVSGSIEEFWVRTLPTWGLSYYTPALYYYGGTYGNYNTLCDSTLLFPNNGFYCQWSNSIYLDYSFMQTKLEQNGDYYPGAFLAHEWGHRIQHHLGSWYLEQGYRSEYHADCLAGLYTRYGYAARRLDGNDYWEGYNWLYYQPQSQSHGYGPYRAAWFQWGYTQYTKAACDQVFAGASGTATSTTSSGGEAATSNASARAARILPPTWGGPVDLTPDQEVTLPAGTKLPVRGMTAWPAAQLARTHD